MTTTRYINTGSSSGGDGTTNATSGANRAWVSRSEAGSSLPSTLTDDFIVYCAGGQDSTSEVWNITTSASNFLQLEINASDEQNGTPSYSGHFFVDKGTGADQMDDIRTDFMRIVGIPYRRNGLTSSSSARPCIRTAVNGSGADIRIERCVFKSIVTGTPTGQITGIDMTDSDPTYRITNCLFYDFDRSNGKAIDCSAASATYHIYNNTIENCTEGVFVSSGTRLVNTVFQNTTTDVNGTPHSSSDYNDTDNGTDPTSGTNDQNTITYTFTDLANEDYSLASGDEQTGQTNSGDSEVPTDDITTTARSSYHRGAFEFISAGGTNAPTSTIYGPLYGPMGGPI